MKKVLKKILNAWINSKAIMMPTGVIPTPYC